MPGASNLDPVHPVITNRPEDWDEFCRRFLPAALIFSAALSFVSAPLYRPSVLAYVVWWALLEAAYVLLWPFFERCARHFKKTVDVRFTAKWEGYYIVRLVSFGVCFAAWGLSLWLAGIAPVAI